MTWLSGWGADEPEPGEQPQYPDIPLMVELEPLFEELRKLNDGGLPYDPDG